MKEYLAYCVFTKTEQKGNTTNNYIEVCIRFVEANSKEEAIGKFMLGTNNILPGYQRSEVWIEESKNYIRIN